jgi:ATP-dependent DNA ligase
MQDGKPVWDQMGLRSGPWRKMRVNLGQELVITGYRPSAKNFDALVIGYYEAGKLIYAARTRNGFTPALRPELFNKLKPLDIRCVRSRICRRKKMGAGVQDSRPRR